MFEIHANAACRGFLGVLESYDYFDVTPVIGREFPSASLKDWLEAPNSDDLIRDLAITSL